MSTHPEWLSQAGITPGRYAELRAICRQYPEYVKALRRRRAGIVDKPNRGPGPWKRPDPTGNAAVSIVDDTAWLDARIKMIERCANKCAPPGVARAVLKSVTRETTYVSLSPPCGKRQFYSYRLWFYVLLDEAIRGM